MKAQPDLVKPYPTNSGIYFEGLGKLKIMHGQLNVVSYVDISYINPHLMKLNEVIGTVRFACQQTTDYNCRSILSPLAVRYNDIKREFESISHLISKREKRAAWFGGIGTVFKHIFGTLDEDDASKYNSAIESVQNDEKTLAKLMKENILITTSTLESYRQTIDKLKINAETLNIAVNMLVNQIHNITEISNKLISETKVHSILTSLESSLLTLSFQLEDLTNAILLCSQNILHPNILSPSQLFQELANNNQHLPKDTEIPISLSLNNIHVILSISTVSCYYYDSKLVFVLHIPLATMDEFILYHNLALPTPHGANADTFSLISPSSSYTAISKDKLSFCNLDSLDKCKTINSEFYLCAMTTVLLTGSNPTCESELLTKTISAIPVQCVTKTIMGELDIWKPLINNQWIFVQSRPTKISIDCNDSQLREVIVSGIGILNLSTQCTVYTKSTRLVSSLETLNISVPTPSLDFNIIDDSCCQIDLKSNSLSTMSPTLLQNIDLDDLSKTNQNDKLFPELNKIINQDSFLVRYGTHYTIFSSLISIIVISFIVFKLIKIFLQYKKKLNISIINPTRTDNDDDTHTRENSPNLPRLREVV